MIATDKNSRIFFIIFFVAIAIAIGVSFYTYVIARDYYITVEAVCDPGIESCFIYECDPAVEEECPADEADRISYYKLVHLRAYAAPDCDPADEDCTQPVCLAGEDCWEVLCSEDMVGPDEQCSTPNAEIFEGMPADL